MLNEVIEVIEVIDDVLIYIYMVIEVTEHIDEIYLYIISVIYVLELYVILDELDELDEHPERLDVIENFISLKYCEMNNTYYIYIRD